MLYLSRKRLEWSHDRKTTAVIQNNSLRFVDISVFEADFVSQ
jgi:hypothetical protein